MSSLSSEIRKKEGEQDVFDKILVNSVKLVITGKKKRGGGSLKIHKNVEFLLRKTENSMLPFVLECFMIYKVIMESVSLCVNGGDTLSNTQIVPSPRGGISRLVPQDAEHPNQRPVCSLVRLGIGRKAK